jgi:hypothetical protein
VPAEWISEGTSNMQVKGRILRPFTTARRA